MSKARTSAAITRRSWVLLRPRMSKQVLQSAFTPVLPFHIPVFVALPSAARIRLRTRQVLNAYMAKAPAGTDVASWDGSGSVWFKVHQIGPQLGGSSISWPSNGQRGYTFKIPASIPAGQYVQCFAFVTLRLILLCTDTS
jgi:hypothetical protein